MIIYKIVYTFALDLLYRMSLTDVYLKNQLKKERVKVSEKSDGDNLWVRLSLKGKVTFFYRFREPGSKNTTRITIGEYPYVTLKQARIKAAEYNEERKYGKNPKYELKLQKVEVENRYTVEQLIRFWYAKDGHNKTSGPQILRSFELHLFDLVAGIYHDDLTTNAWLTLLEQIAEKTESIAVRLLTNIKLAQKLGVRRGLIKNHSLQHITAKADLGIIKNKRDRNLTDQEIYFILHASFRSNRLHPKNLGLVLFCLFFGNRIGEARLAIKSDFDFDKHIWTVPVANHKTGEITNEPIVRPMIPHIERFLKRLIYMNASNRNYVFGFVDSRKDGPVSETTHLCLPDRITQQVKKIFNVEMKQWSMHDLRRTMRTHMSEFALPHICEIMIGHALPQTWGTYDYFQYLQPQADAYQKWFDRLVDILNNHESFDSSKGVKDNLSALPVASSHFATIFLE